MPEREPGTESTIRDTAKLAKNLGAIVVYEAAALALRVILGPTKEEPAEAPVAEDKQTPEELAQSVPIHKEYSIDDYILDQHGKDGVQPKRRVEDVRDPIVDAVVSRIHREAASNS